MRHIHSKYVACGVLVVAVWSSLLVLLGVFVRVDVKKEPIAITISRLESLIVNGGPIEAIEEEIVHNPGSVTSSAPLGNPLDHAVLYRRLHVVEMLLEHGADPNLRRTDLGNQGTLHIGRATALGDIALVEVLLQHGASPDMRDAKGRNAWDELQELKEQDPENHKEIEAHFRRFGFNTGR